MAVNDTFGYTWAGSTGAASIPQKQVFCSGASESNIDTTLASGVTQVNFNLTQSKCVGFFAVSDSAVNLSTNLSGGVSGSCVFNLAPNNPLVWTSGYSAIPFFSGNITTTYWSNSGAGVNSGAQANVSVRTVEVP